MTGPVEDASFDYIVVGAGSAGCVLAERLSADGRNQVLLVEEGPGDDDWIVRMPKGFGKVLTDPARTHFFPTAHDRGAGRPPEVWVRGKLLGGSSSVNGMVWTRGQPADYDRLAERAGSQWSWSEMLPYLRGIEHHAMGADETRGEGGPITVKTHPAPNALTDAFLAAGAQLGLPVKADQNRVEQEGIGYLQWNIDARGRRVSASRGFLGRAQGRANLTIATGVRTDRVTIEAGRANGIAGMRNGKPVRFRARGEVILSAGALATPKILQLSGIGPAATLAAAGVPVLLDNGDIGHHLREHLLIMQHFRLRDAAYSDNRAFAGLNLVRNVVRHLVFGTGPMSMGSSEAAAFVRASPESMRPDLQIMFAPYSLDVTRGMVFDDEPGMQLYAMILRPQSEGSVLIASPDPAAMPRIEPNYHTAETDRRTSIAGVRYIRRLMAQPAIAPFVTGETEPTASAATDEEILETFRRYGQSGYHAVATVAMGREGTPLDGRLRLRGIERLRVVDCSVFPEMIAGNTNAPTMAMAARAADLMLEDKHR